MAFAYLIDFHKKVILWGVGVLTAIFQLSKLELK